LASNTQTAATLSAKFVLSDGEALLRSEISMKVSPKRAAIMLIVATLAAARPAHAQHAWEGYRNEAFGYSINYPADIFRLSEESQSNNSASFEGNDGARLKLYAAVNDEGMSLREYRQTLLTKFSGYDNIDYGPIGQTWFVLSGTRNDMVYYQKIIFSCGGNVINAMAMEYPAAQKRAFDAIVTGLEKTFKPGSGEACPQRER
jgi:hypothetical protein